MTHVILMHISLIALIALIALIHNSLMLLIHILLSAHLTHSHSLMFLIHISLSAHALRLMCI